MTRKGLKPNHKIMLDSAVCALQQTYEDYKRAVVDNLKWSWFDENGVFTILDGAEERNRKIEDLKCEVMRLMLKVEEIKAESEDEE